MKQLLSLTFHLGKKADHLEHHNPGVKALDWEYGGSSIM